MGHIIRISEDIPSFFSSLYFVETPPFPLYPPKEPSDLITLWQGISMGLGFFPHAFATARAEFGFPIAIAISLYVLTSPLGIFF